MEWSMRIRAKSTSDSVTLTVSDEGRATLWDLADTGLIQVVGEKWLASDPDEEWDRIAVATVSQRR